MNKIININKSPKPYGSGPIFMMACGSSVTKALTYDCAYAPAGGTEVVCYIANRADIDTVTYDGTNTSMITAITMVATKKFYKYTGYKNAWDPEVTLNKGPYGNNYVHAIAGVLGIGAPADKEELQNLFQSNVVVIIENKKKGLTGNEAFEVYGISCGLSADSMTRKQRDNDTQGAYKFNLKSPDGEFEPKLANTLWVSPSLAATRAYIATLI